MCVNGGRIRKRPKKTEKITSKNGRVLSEETPCYGKLKIAMKDGGSEMLCRGSTNSEHKR